MKKTFKLTDPKKAPARQLDYVKFEISKYIARERRKPLDSGVDYWDFDCKIGASQEDSSVIHVAEINKSIDKIAEKNFEEFYIEILAKPARRMKK
jgi:hypothetical protein